MAALFFAAITFLIFWGYLLPGNAIVGSDGMGPPADLAMMHEEGSYFSSWRAFAALGHLNYPSPTLSAYYLVSMEWLNLSPLATTQMIIVSSFWLAGFAMYLCARRILDNNTAAMFAGFAYLFNQVFLSQVTEAHHYFLIGYALFPLLFLCIYIAINDLKRWTAVAIPILGMLYGTMVAPNLILITVVFLILFFALYVPLSKNWSWSRRAYATLVGVTTVLLLLLPTILAKYLSGGTPVLGTSYPIEQAGYLSSYSLFHSFIMAASENSFIFGSSIGQWPFIGSLWYIATFIALIVPIVALSALLGKKRRTLVIALVIPAVIFMIVANGPNPPYGHVFTYLFKNIPLMDSIRVYSRFHLLTGFAIAMMLGVVIADISEIKPEINKLRGRWGRAMRRIFISKELLICLVAFCLVFPSSAILTGEVRTFEVPDSYIAPYEWVGEQDGSFRIINLPYQQIFYKSYMAHYDGYPSTQTMDVGMYSPTYSKTPYVFGLETENYWTFVGSTINGREYGYKEMSGLLGGTANVRYFVAQIYADPSQVDLFGSLSNITLAETFEGGASVYSNGEWAARVHTLDTICLVSGDRSIIPTVMGLVLSDLTSDGVVMINQVEDQRTLEQLIGQADYIVVPNHDLIQLAYELSLWSDGQTIDLTDYGDKHTVDPKPGWIVSTVDEYSGYASGPTLVTTGRNAATLSVTAQESGDHDILLRVVYEPNAGRLNVTVDGQRVLTTVPYASDYTSRWIRLEDVNLSKGSHLVTISNDGTGRISLERMMVMPHDLVEEKLTQVEQVLSDNSDKVVYVYSGALAPQWDHNSYLNWQGTKGWGIADTLHFPVADLTRNGTFIYDPNALNSIALWVGPEGVTLTPVYRGSEDGRTYHTEFSLRYIGNPVGPSVGTVTVYGRNTTTGVTTIIGTGPLLKGSSPSSIYSNYSYELSVPEGYSNISLVAAPALGVDDLCIDQLSITNSATSLPSMSINVPRDGNYVLKVDGSSNASPYVIVDGTTYPLSRISDNMEFDLPNMTSGQHTVQFGIDYIYGAMLGSFQNPPNASTAVASFERTSNLEYKVQVTSDGPTWILISESYNSLWEANLDGKTLEHVKVNSMVNAYYIPEGGVHNITVTFKGQQVYDEMIVSIIAATIVSIIVLAVFQYPVFHNGREGRLLLLNGILLRFPRRGGR
jgi:hypothetical protein